MAQDAVMIEVDDMKAAPLVSIVLPFFNAAATLPMAMGSILAQTYQDWELILFDDGSTDASLEIAETFARSDTRFRIIASEHVGIVKALAAACRAARGVYIARMDADDVSHPERLASQVELMERTPDIGMCGTRVRMTGSNVRCGRKRYEAWINSLVTHEDIVREMFVECPMPHPSVVMRRASFQKAGGYCDGPWPEDYDLCMRLFLAGEKFGKVPEILLDWADSPSRLSMTDDRYSPARFRDIKRHYLFQTYLKDRRTFHQWGAGEIGKPWLREWSHPRPAAVVDVNPHKIGTTIHETPVIPPDDLPQPGHTYIVIAVGAPNARIEIRDWLRPRGYRELDDFLFLA